MLLRSLQSTTQQCIKPLARNLATTPSKTRGVSHLLNTKMTTRVNESFVKNVRHSSNKTVFSGKLGTKSYLPCSAIQRIFDYLRRVNTASMKSYPPGSFNHNIHKIVLGINRGTEYMVTSVPFQILLILIIANRIFCPFISYLSSCSSSNKIKEVKFE